MNRPVILPRDTFDPEKGEIPKGWMVTAWRHRLLEMADRCWDDERAEQLRRWAEKLEV